MSDGVIFAIFFLGLFALRAIAATIVFLVILPQGDRCPMCDAATLRVQSRTWNFLLPWMRTSWCYCCGWEGLLRNTPVTKPAPGDLPRAAAPRRPADRPR